MSWSWGPITSTEVEMMVRVLVAVILGSVPGWQREREHRPAGLRTHMLVSAGSACFTVASIYGFGGGGVGVDTSRVAAQIVTGVGFLGAGTIWRQQSTVRGLTTAAGIWIVAAIGMLAGTGLYAVAIFTTLLCWLTLTFLRPPGKRRLPPPGQVSPDDQTVEDPDND